MKRMNVKRQHHILPSFGSLLVGRNGKSGRLSKQWSFYIQRIIDDPIISPESFTFSNNFSLRAYSKKCPHLVITNSEQYFKSFLERNSLVRSFSTSSSVQSNSSVKTNEVKDNEVVPINNDFLPGKLIDFQIQSKIDGEESHVVTIDLYPGDVLRAESGSMIFMTEGVISKYF
jgi:hypothetical protein